VGIAKGWELLPKNVQIKVRNLEVEGRSITQDKIYLELLEKKLKNKWKKRRNQKETISEAVNLFNQAATDLKTQIHTIHEENRQEVEKVRMLSAKK
jgi:hypothetical protein